MNSFALTAIPLFILMAEIMQHSGLSFRIYRGLSKLVCVIPGGLLQTNIAGCALFAAISGSSVATAAAIGTRGAAAAHPARLPPAAGGRLAGGRRHARHPDPAVDRHDRLRHLHRDLGVASCSWPASCPGLLLTGAVHGLRRSSMRCCRPEIAPRERGPQNLAEFGAALGRPGAVRAGDRRHHGQPLFRLGDADRGRRGRLRASASSSSAIWGELGWPELKAAHDLVGDDQRQHPADRLHRLRLLLRHQRGRRRRAAHQLAGRR